MVVRFIPASAGNTKPDWFNGAVHSGSSPRLRGTLYYYTIQLNLVTVHPRVCGEHMMF